MSTTSKTLLTDLPNELLELIFAKLAIRDVFRTETTCKKWKTLIWSSQTDIIFPYYQTQHQRTKAVTAAIHKILTAADPVKISKLDLNTTDYELNDQDIAALKKMKSLNYLSIDFTDMTQERCSFIPHLTNLQHLALNTKLIQECIDSVGSAHLPHLTSLAIIARPLIDLTPLQNLTRVKALDLRFCQLLDNTSIIALFNSMTQIDTLDIARATGMSSDAFESVSCLTNLTDLSIAHVCYSANGKAVLNKVLSALPKLKSLDMNYLVDYNNETVKIISNMTDLTRLMIYFDEFRPAEALSKLTNMQHLVVSASSDKRKSDKFYSVMTNLTSLTIRMAASEFSNLDRLTQLRSLTINSKDQIDGSFYPYVQKMTQLEHLDFQYSTFSVMQLGSLSSLQFLTHLNVKNISYLKKSIPEIINSLVQLTNLRSLRTLSDWSVEWLLELPNLEQLEISFPCNISVDNTAVKFLTSLVGMTKLHSLSMMYNPCSSKIVSELFREHRNLTSLCVNSSFV